MNLDTFFAVASPSTLASLIGDIDTRNGEHDQDINDLRVTAWDALCANIGEGDATKLVMEERGGVITPIQATIREYVGGKSPTELSTHTRQCFVGMIQGGEATYADFQAIGGDVLAAMVAKDVQRV